MLILFLFVTLMVGSDAANITATGGGIVADSDTLTGAFAATDWGIIVDSAGLVCLFELPLPFEWLFSSCSSRTKDRRNF